MTQQSIQNKYILYSDQNESKHNKNQTAVSDKQTPEASLSETRQVRVLVLVPVRTALVNSELKNCFKNPSL